MNKAAMILFLMALRISDVKLNNEKYFPNNCYIMPMISDAACTGNALNNFFMPDTEIWCYCLKTFLLGRSQDYTCFNSEELCPEIPACKSYFTKNMDFNLVKSAEDRMEPEFALSRYFVSEHYDYEDKCATIRRDISNFVILVFASYHGNFNAVSNYYEELYRDNCGNSCRNDIDFKGRETIDINWLKENVVVLKHIINFLESFVTTDRNGNPGILTSMITTHILSDIWIPNAKTEFTKRNVFPDECIQNIVQSCFDIVLRNSKSFNDRYSKSKVTSN